MEVDAKPLSDAENFEEFKNLRHAAPDKAAAEPAAEKVTQAEEASPASAADSGAAEPITQEQQEPAEKSVEDQIKELRAKGKHAAANKLMAEEASRPHREEAEKLRKELESLRSRPSEAAPKPEPKPAAAVPAQQATDPNDPEPRVTDDKYAGADGWTLFNRDSALWAFRQETKQAKRQEEIAAHNQKGRQIFETGKAKHADFETVVSRVVINQGVLDEGVKSMDNLADVLYRVGSDAAELTRIQALSPMDQWAELKILSRELSKTPANVIPLENRKPAVSRVSAPPRVLSGNDTPEPKGTSEARDYDEFKRLRKALRAS